MQKCDTPIQAVKKMSAHASYDDITIALNLDSCICQNCFCDHYRNQIRPYLYRMYEEITD